MTAHPSSADIKAGTPLAGQKTINLALQGGGTHGAFTWGVLDRMLEEERLSFDGITATSTGSIDAVLLAQGLASGGRAAARELLRTFWKRTSDMMSASILAPSFFDKMNPNFGLEHSPGFVFVDLLTRFMSPYQLNPRDINPMRDLLNELVDFERIRRQQAIKLFLCATNVRTGKVAVFTNSEITADHVLASGCVPFRMRAPQIGDEHYWDGGFMGNPAIFPVIYGCESRDVVIVHLTPTERAENPTDSRSILNRMEEISFNASLMREMRVVAFVTKLIDDGQLTDGKRMFIHLIEAEDVFKKLSGTSKANADWTFLTHLFTLGRERADKWLSANFDRLGVETTVDIKSRYL